MRLNHNRCPWIAVPALLLASGITAARAQDAATKPTAAREQPRLPKAEEILDKSVEAGGGRSAFEKLRNRVMTASVSVAAVGIKGSLKLYTAEPNKSAVESDLGPIGKAQEGTNGEIAWEVSTMTGPRLKTGAERDQTIRAATFNSELHWRKMFKKAECTGVEAVEGRDCYVVVLSPDEGAPFTNYIDKETYVTLKTATTATTQMGDLPIEVYLSDYRKVDGVQVPFSMRNRIAMQEMVITVEKVEHNVELPKGVFDPPPEIAELLEKPKAAASAPADTKKPATTKP